MKFKILGMVGLGLSVCLSPPVFAGRQVDGVTAAQERFQTAQALPELIKPKLLEPKIVELKGYFFDDFDGADLKKEWEVINRNRDHFVVEDGALLLLSTRPGSLKTENIENLLRLSKPMPKGDWIITAKFTIEIQTFKEHFMLGLYDDKDNWIIAESFTAENWDKVTIRARKSAKGEFNSFQQHIAYSKTRHDRNFAKSHSKPQYLQLRKQGRNYLVFAKFENQENWIELQKLTSLRAKGNLIVGFTQYKKVGGESFVKIDWVKIEVPK